MISPEEFQKQTSGQTRKLENFRILPESKAFIAALKAKYSLESEGKALDFLMYAYPLLQASKPVSEAVSSPESESRIQQLTQALEAAKAEKAELQKQLEFSNQEKAYSPEQYELRLKAAEEHRGRLWTENEQLKELLNEFRAPLTALDGMKYDLSKAMRELFSSPDLLPLNYLQAVLLLVDYCQADPVQDVYNILQENNIQLTPELEKRIENMRFPRPEISLSIYKELTHGRKEEAANTAGENKTETGAKEEATGKSGE